MAHHRWRMDAKGSRITSSEEGEKPSAERKHESRFFPVRRNLPENTYAFSLNAIRESWLSLIAFESFQGFWG